MILSLSTAQRFISGTTSNSFELGKGTRILLHGHVNQETGKLYFAENSPWRFDVNDLNLTYHGPNNFETCEIGAMASRMLRVGRESVAYQLAQRVWEFGHCNSENRKHQLPASIPLLSISRPTFLASSHKGWPTKPPGEFPPLSLAPAAVFLDKDRLAVGNGFSLIHGGENGVFFLQQEGAAQIMTQPEITGVLGPKFC